ncbi:MAG: hypothetical protein KGL35_24805 [Bradyrhizobium sp.]|nr:hypothetical protein [Bradyrhizobium sp.]
MPSFTDRLCKCQKASEMTISDLMRWFDRPRATVNTWLNGRTPFGPPAALAEKRLAMLEFSIKTRSGHYPVPAELTWKQRENYVRGMRHDAERNYRVPNMRAAG